MNLIVQKTQIKRYGWFRILPVIGVLVFILCWQAGFALSQEWATSGTNIYNTNSGNVGIGTTGPSDVLEIQRNAPNDQGGLTLNNANNNGYGSSIIFKGGYDGGYDFSRIETENSGGTGGKMIIYTSDTYKVLQPRVFINHDGNVGIGTTNPDSLLELETPSGITLNLHLNSGKHSFVKVDRALNTYEAAVKFQSAGTDEWDIATADSTGNLYFRDSGIPRITFADGGNVGIGTTNPATVLHIVGDVTVTGNIAAKYQDIAEWVYSPMSVASGTVVVLDIQDINRVIPSSLSYDTRVAGVVTETPGILLGEEGNGKIKVATTGRVKVKVDATKEPIEIGDLLVTSDREGYAMRSEPVDVGGIPIHRPGTLIGKALEPLKEGQGEILVLLSLQ